jgi:hypothetical protein
MTAPTTLRFQQLAFDLAEGPCRLPEPPPSLLFRYGKPSDAAATKQLAFDLD